MSTIHPPRPRHFFLRLGFAVLVFFLLSLAGDRLLGWFGFSGDLREPAAYPPRFREQRKTLEYQYSFATNGQGLRYRELPLPKPAGSYRVLALGDSYTLGEGVEEGQRFTDRLEKEFSATGREVRFINGGLTGAGPLEYGRLWFRAGLAYHPDALLICLYANDVYNTEPGFTPRMFLAPPAPPSGFRKLLYLLWPHGVSAVKLSLNLRAKEETGRTTDLVETVTRQARQEGIPEPELAAWKSRLPPELVAAVNRGEFNGNSLAYGLLNPWYWVDAIDLTPDVGEPKVKAMTALLDALVADCRKRGLAVAVLYLPSPFQYDPAVDDPKIPNPWRVSGVILKKEWLTGQTPAQARLEDWAAYNQVPFLDLTPALREAVQQPAQLTYPLDGHFTPAGHAAAAKIIRQWIMEKKVFPFAEKWKY